MLATGGKILSGYGSENELESLINYNVKNGRQSYFCAIYGDQAAASQPPISSTPSQPSLKHFTNSNTVRLSQLSQYWGYGLNPLILETPQFRRSQPQIEAAHCHPVVHAYDCIMRSAATYFRQLKRPTNIVLQPKVGGRGTVVTDPPQKPTCLMNFF
jgi:hypothetical protein